MYPEIFSFGAKIKQIVNLYIHLLSSQQQQQRDEKGVECRGRVGGKGDTLANNIGIWRARSGNDLAAILSAG